MNGKFLSDTLFPIIRAGLNISCDIPRDEIDYELLTEIGKRHELIPIIREGLCSLNIKADNEIEKLCKQEIYQFVLRDDAIDRICGCFNKNEIDFILLKGAVLRDLYPDKWMRTSCDIDVLVKEKDVRRAVETLEKDTDFKYQSTQYHDILLQTQNVSLELHFNIKEKTENLDKLLLRVWDNCTKKEGSYEYVLTPEFQIFHAVAHMSYHFVHGGMGIRPYIDLWLLRHKTEYDESIVKKMCDECGILKFYEECCFLSEVWLGGEKHTDVSKMLEKYSIAGNVFGDVKNILLQENRNHNGRNYILSRIFQSREVLRASYPILDKHPYLVPYFQLRRWIRALVRGKSKIKNEINLLQTMSDGDRELYEKLMKSVGM